MTAPHPLRSSPPSVVEPSYAPLDVLAWRYDELTRAGYPVDAALCLAERVEIDLHSACDLLRRGATLTQALRILD